MFTSGWRPASAARSLRRRLSLGSSPRSRVALRPGARGWRVPLESGGAPGRAAAAERGRAPAKS